MPKVTRKLTEKEIQAAKPQAKPYKLYDEGGLLLLVRPKTFIDLVQLGFIGTQSLASHEIALFIEEAIKSGHSVLYAIDSRAKGTAKINGS